MTIRSFEGGSSSVPTPFLVRVCSLCRSCSRRKGELVSTLRLDTMLDVVGACLVEHTVYKLSADSVAELFPLILGSIVGRYGKSCAGVIRCLGGGLVGGRHNGSTQVPSSRVVQAILRCTGICGLEFALEVVFSGVRAFGGPTPISLDGLDIRRLVPRAPAGR